MLSQMVDTVSRCQPDAPCGKIVQEANAIGKADGYADVDTVVWTIES
jgi:hypothetical protein